MEEQALQTAETPPQAANSELEQPLNQSEIIQIEDLQEMIRGEIMDLQALIGRIDPEQQDEYSALISQLQNSNNILTAALAKPTSANLRSARGVLRNNAYNAAAMETADLSDDIQPKEPLLDCSTPPANQLSDAATQILQNVQSKMQSNIQSDDILKQHAETIVINNGTMKPNDELLENLILINALKSLPYDQFETLNDMAHGDLSLGNLKKINNNFASEGLISVESLNGACHAASCHHSNNIYAQQIIAVSSFANAMQMGQMLAYEYMEQAMQKQKQNGVSFTPETKVIDAAINGRVAPEPISAHLALANHN
jgi:hypothetical protein